MKKAIIVALLLSGCATQPLLIDPKTSKNPENVYQDQGECTQIVETKYSAVESGAKMAGWGGVLGAIIGAAGVKAGFSGQPLGVAIAAGAITTAIAMGGSGAYDTLNKKDELLVKCMEGRGYVVLEK